MRISLDDAGARPPRPVGVLDEGRFCIFVPSYNDARLDGASFDSGRFIRVKALKEALRL